MLTGSLRGFRYTRPGRESVSASCFQCSFDMLDAGQLRGGSFPPYGVFIPYGVCLHRIYPGSLSLNERYIFFKKRKRISKKKEDVINILVCYLFESFDSSTVSPILAMSFSHSFRQSFRQSVTSTAQVAIQMPVCCKSLQS